MPYCSKCGNQVGAVDSFCGRCGAPQPVAANAGVATDPLASIQPRTASILCYVPALGWIAAIIVLASQRFRRDRNVRFHAFQGLYLFVAWLMADWVFRPMIGFMVPQLHLHNIVQLILLGMSIFMMIKAAHDQPYSLPLFGELAQRSVMEN
jgi:uncharacterized membrane protein